MEWVRGDAGPPCASATKPPPSSSQYPLHKARNKQSLFFDRYNCHKHMSKPIILLPFTGPEFSSDTEKPVNTWLTETRGPSVKRNSRPATHKLSYSCMDTEVHHCVYKTIPFVILILINSFYTLRSKLFLNELSPYNLHIYNQISNVISSFPIFRLKLSLHYSSFSCAVHFTTFSVGWLVNKQERI